MRRLMLAMLCGFVIGCGGSEFKTEGDELSYLSSLSNPTPSQWKRKNELVNKQIERDERMSKILNAPIVAKAAADKAKDDSATIKRWMEAAQDLEANKQPELASRYYADIINKYPDTEASKKASERLQSMAQIP